MTAVAVLLTWLTLEAVRLGATLLTLDSARDKDLRQAAGHPYLTSRHRRIRLIGILEHERQDAFQLGVSSPDGVTRCPPWRSLAGRGRMSSGGSLCTLHRNFPRIPGAELGTANLWSGTEDPCAGRCRLLYGRVLRCLPSLSTSNTEKTRKKSLRCQGFGSPSPLVVVLVDSR
jgi:hypothetical protein